jgi:hypothetical protein
MRLTKSATVSILAAVFLSSISLLAQTVPTEQSPLLYRDDVAVCLDHGWESNDPEIRNLLERIRDENLEAIATDAGLTCLDPEEISQERLGELSARIAAILEKSRPLAFNQNPTGIKRNQGAEVSLFDSPPSDNPDMFKLPGKLEKKRSNLKIMLLTSAIMTGPEAAAIFYYYKTEPTTRDHLSINTLRKTLSSWPGPDPQPWYEAGNLWGHGVQNGTDYAVARYLGANWKIAWLSSVIEQLAWKTVKGEGWYAAPMSRTDLINSVWQGPVFGEAMYRGSLWVWKKIHHRSY